VKQILVISGKGGTGKTVVAACLAVLANKSVIADCDVDAADLHLLLHPEIKQTRIFTGLPKAVIDQEKCTSCGECVKACRYGVVLKVKSEYKELKPKKLQSPTSDFPLPTSHFFIDTISCEGCAVCTHVCPVSAIFMTKREAGQWFISETQFGTMVHAKLGIAEENSGMLVTTVRKEAQAIAQKNNLEYVIIDGPPGIGCPVIASLTGVDIALIVTEPTLSGIHDMTRVLKLANSLGIKAACVINKYDININNTEKISDLCHNTETPILGQIPYDEAVIESIVAGVPLTMHVDNNTTAVLKQIWQQLKEY